MSRVPECRTGEKSGMSVSCLGFPDRIFHPRTPLVPGQAILVQYRDSHDFVMLTAGAGEEFALFEINFLMFVLEPLIFESGFFHRLFSKNFAV